MKSTYWRGCFMGKTFGQAVANARKKCGMKAATLAGIIGVSPAAMSVIENDAHKGGPDPEMVNRIADALNENGLRLIYLETNPVFKEVIPRIFPELNNIRTEPAIVFSRFADEAEEAVMAARDLSQVFSHADPRSIPDFDKRFVSRMEQIIDVQRCAEILITALVAAGIITETGRRGLHDRQQVKCERNGHHKPEKEEAA